MLRLRRGVVDHYTNDVERKNAAGHQSGRPAGLRELEYQREKDDDADRREGMDEQRATHQRHPDRHYAEQQKGPRS